MLVKDLLPLAMLAEDLLPLANFCFCGQLLVTGAIMAPFSVVDAVREYCFANVWVVYTALAINLVACTQPSSTVIGCKACRRWPLNSRFSCAVIGIVCCAPPRLLLVVNASQQTPMDVSGR